MEVDSVHSAIEFTCRNVDIYSPTDYYRLVALAGTRGQYQVVQLDATDVTDYKAMTNAFIRNRNVDTEKGKVNWLQMKWLKYEKVKPNQISFRYDYESEFRTIIVNVGGRGRRPESFPEERPLFGGQTPKIALAKFNDLISLCDSLVIPRDYHAFYHSLPHCNKVRDALTEPDELEESDNE